MPFFSIIIPSFNRGHVLTKAIESILLQSSSDFEIIIVDDGSSDNTKEILTPYLSLPFVRYFYQENKGVSAARNLGALNAVGNYLVFLDSDDYVEKCWLLDFYILLKENNFLIGFCNIKTILPNNKIKLINALDPHGTGRSTGGTIPGSWSIKRELFIQIGMYDEKIKFGENYELLLRVKKLKIKEGFVLKYNLIYYSSDNGGSKNNLNKLVSNQYIVEKHKDHFNANKNTKKLFLQIAGMAAIKLGHQKKANQLFKGLLSENKTDLKLWLLYLITLSTFLTQLKWPIDSK